MGAYNNATLLSKKATSLFNVRNFVTVLPTNGQLETSHVVTGGGAELSTTESAIHENLNKKIDQRTKVS